MRFKEYLLFETTLNEGVFDPAIFKGIFMAGGPGSGKSFVAEKVTPGLGLRMINSDVLFKKLMDKAGLDTAEMDKFTKKQEAMKDAIRTRAKGITNRQLKTLIGHRIGVVIDGTGRRTKKTGGQRETLTFLGYDTYMVFVNTTLDVALERNKQRPRVLPDKTVIDAWKNVQANMGFYQNLFKPNFFKIVDNNKHVTDDKVFASAWKEVMKFVRKPIINPIAQEWIKAELESRKRT